MFSVCAISKSISPTPDQSAVMSQGGSKSTGKSSARKRGSILKSLSRGTLGEENAAASDLKDGSSSARLNESSPALSQTKRDLGTASSSSARNTDRLEPESHITKIEPFKLTIPLAHQDNPTLSFDDKFNDMIRHEYAVRYLEHLGVKASSTNISMVRSQIPIEESDVTAFYRSRGWLADYLQIKPSNLTKERKVRLRSNSKLVSNISAIANDKVDPRAFTQPAPADQQGAASNPGSSGNPERPTEKETSKNKDMPGFREMNKKFVYPFSQGSRLKKGTAGKSYSSIQPGSDGTQTSSSSQSHAQLSARKSVAFEGDAAKSTHSRSNSHPRIDVMEIEEAEEELITTNLNVSDKLVSDIQQAFIEKYSFDMLQHRLSEENISALKKELSSIHQRDYFIARFIAMACEYLYWKFLGRKILEEQSQYGITRPIRPENLQSYEKHYFLSLHQMYNKIEARVQKKLGHKMIFVPVILLMLRVSVEAIFRNNFPKWSKFKEAEGIYKEMDSSIVSIFDPEQYIFHMSTAESTSEGMRLSAAPKRFREKGLQGKYYSTSPMVKCLFGTEAVAHTHQKYLRPDEASERLPDFTQDEALRKQLYHLTIQRLHPDQSVPLPSLGRPASLANLGKPGHIITIRGPDEYGPMGEMTGDANAALIASGVIDAEGSRGSRSRPRSSDSRVSRASRSHSALFSRDALHTPVAVISDGSALPIPHAVIPKTRSNMRLAELETHLSKLANMSLSGWGAKQDAAKTEEEEKEALEKERKARELTNMVGGIVERIPRNTPTPLSQTRRYASPTHNTRTPTPTESHSRPS